MILVMLRGVQDSTLGTLPCVNLKSERNSQLEGKGSKERGSVYTEGCCWVLIGALLLANFESLNLGGFA
jgi:hypothetical protein